jgi:hypothetical protein
MPAAAADADAAAMPAAIFRRCHAAFPLQRLPTPAPLER